MTRELVIPSRPESIHQVEGLIEDIRDEFQFKDDVYGNVMIATTEAVNNSIIHGNKSDVTKTVTIRVLTPNPYRLKIEVTDQGPGFDYQNLSDPTAPENLENPGGRGVFLMSHLCDELNFADEGRKVELVFNI